MNEDKQYPSDVIRFIEENFLISLLKMSVHFQFSYWQGEDYILMRATRNAYKVADHAQVYMLDYDLGYPLYHWLKTEGFKDYVDYKVITEPARRSDG